MLLFKTFFIGVKHIPGNRYESVRSPSTESKWFGLWHEAVSPPGDHALPGDIVPRLPPIRSTGVVFASLASPAFWLTASASTYLGWDWRSDGGFRHVGRRFQVFCDEASLIACHSIDNIYIKRLQDGQARNV